MKDMMDARGKIDYFIAGDIVFFPIASLGHACSEISNVCFLSAKSN